VRAHESLVGLEELEDVVVVEYQLRVQIVDILPLVHHKDRDKVHQLQKAHLILIDLLFFNGYELVTHVAVQQESGILL